MEQVRSPRSMGHKRLCTVAVIDTRRMLNVRPDNTEIYPTLHTLEVMLSESRQLLVASTSFKKSGKQAIKRELNKTCTPYTVVATHSTCTP